MVRFGFFILPAFIGCAVAHGAIAQSITDTKPAKLDPVDFGAGYKMAIAGFDQQHAANIPDDPDAPPNPTTLHLSYPLIASPLTPEAKVYNNAITQLIRLWWADIGAPKDNSQQTDPYTDYALDCAPGGALPPEGGPGVQVIELMLPGVISITCHGYLFPHGGAHGGSSDWGFNWIVSKRRAVQPDDIFVANSGWLKALTALANSYRQDAAPWSKKLDFADRHHWVLGANGFGLTYTIGEFVGYSEGGVGMFAIIPWSKLKPYLNPHGIVPQSDWNTTLPAGN